MMCDRIAPVTLPRVSKKNNSLQLWSRILVLYRGLLWNSNRFQHFFPFQFLSVDMSMTSGSVLIVSPLKLHAAEALLLNWIRRAGKLWASSRRSMQLGEKPLETLQIVQSDMFKRTWFGVLTLSGWRLIHAPQWQNHRMQNQVIDKLVDLERKW